MKTGTLARIGLIVGVVGVAAICVRVIQWLPAHRLASLSGIAITVSDETESSVSPKGTSGDTNVLDFGAVVVQTFSGTSLVRQGSGTSVSSDGLILTVSSVAPYVQGAVYQIATPRGDLLRARRIASDPTTGLVVLKADATSTLEAVSFDESIVLSAGTHLSARAAIFSLSRYTPMALDVQVVYSDAHTTALALDHSFANRLLGARLIDDRGRAVGIVRPVNGGIGLIPAAAVNAFIEHALTMVQNP